MDGKIKWYKQEKGYGFIAGEDGKDYFVHHSALPEEQKEKDIRENDNIEVTFEVKTGRDGRLQATNVVLMDKNSSSDDDSSDDDDEE
ncbi:cold shock domain-containing protein [Candidatus Woesearchaeota archaeon]|nr:cold shock domain-containing protein [Nanoarchaeota archaeon]MCB9370164.1 cold shock domain-containing protein [Candidatus Woesearchaeota archaeon]USN44694.1 MAG: cold shock domain-containing protein [Candidatus Woesearchaeota archaeon]